MKMHSGPESPSGRDLHLHQGQACLRCRAALGATLLITLLGPHSVARAVPTLLLRLEHSGREIGIAVKDRVRLRAAGFTWSDGTIDLLREPVPCASSPNSYIAGGFAAGIVFDASAGESDLHLSEDLYNTMMHRAMRIDAIAHPASLKPPIPPQRSSAGATVHMTEVSLEPAVRDLNPHP